MSIAYWCLLIAAVLPYVLVTVGRAGFAGYDNRDPRGWSAAQTHPRARRMYAAHLNAFEAFAPFAAGVLAAQAAGVDPARIAPLSVAFVACRVLHGESRQFVELGVGQCRRLARRAPDHEAAGAVRSVKVDETGPCGEVDRAVVPHRSDDGDETA